MLRVNLGGAALEGLWLDRRPDIGDGGAKKKKKNGPKLKTQTMNTRGLPVPV